MTRGGVRVRHAKRLLEPLGGRDLGSGEPAVVEGGGHERAVTSALRQPNQILQPSDTASSQQRHVGRGLAYSSDQLEVEPGVRSHARQVEHDHGERTSVGGPRCNDGGRLTGRNSRPGPRGRDGFAVAQVEAEGDAVAMHCVTDFSERLVRRERFEPDHDACRTDAERVTHLVDARYTGVQPERRREGSEGGDRRVLRGSVRLRSSGRVWAGRRVLPVPEDCVQIRGVQLGQAEAFQVQSPKLQRVAGLNRCAGRGVYGEVCFPSSRPRVNGAAGDQIEDTDHSHSDVSMHALVDPAPLCSLVAWMAGTVRVGLEGRR